MRPMRGVASLFALGLMMALFHRVTAGAALEARATLALGFLLLAALVGGDLTTRARLPRITGYVLVGFIVGPWLGLVRRDEVDALRFIGDVALGVIALAAGTELALPALRDQLVALARLAGGAIAFPLLVVAAVLVSVSPWFPLTAHQSLGDGVAVALVLGALSAVSSPAVAMGMLSELDAPGPFARTLLAVTVVKDVAAAILFTLLLAAGKAFASAGALNATVAGHALLGLAASLAVGALLGYGVSRYLGLLQRHVALFLVAVAVVAAEVARLAQLEPSLMALAAGVYLASFAPVQGERVRHELQRGWPPVYILFFVLAGAGLRVSALAELWPWVLLLVGLRAMSLRYGLLWAGRHPSVTPTLAREGWLGLVPQAGSVLVLAQVARRAFPEWGVSLETLVVAMIGVHEVVGPICFRRALTRAGEITEDMADAEGSRGGTVVALGGRL
jgi:Kef-type K+ transport system membrane component KefB